MHHYNILPGSWILPEMRRNIPWMKKIVSQTIAIKQQQKIKTPDAIIAATAIVYNCILITNNILDFKNISGLNLINAYELK